MPTYNFECPDGHISEGFFYMSEKPNEVECGNPDCGKMAVALIGAGGGVIFKGSFPGKDVREDTTNETLVQKAKRARRWKLAGKVPIEERIKPSDVDLSKPDNTPPVKTGAVAGPKPKSGPGS